MMFTKCICADPPRDYLFPPSFHSPTVRSGGCDLYGVLYGAQGKGPRPTILFLHGFPGNEKNVDLAQIFRRAGFNTMLFSYRGAWGSEGSFSFSNVLEDSLAAVEFLRSDEARERFAVDGDRIVLVGHSMGGFTAIRTAAVCPFIRETVSISGWNVGLDGLLFPRDRIVEERVRGLVEGASQRLAGACPDALIREIVGGGNAFDLRCCAPSFAGRSVLLVGASDDVDVPPAMHHDMLLAALRATEGVHAESAMLPDDHSYSASRIALAETLLKYLEERGY